MMKLMVFYAALALAGAGSVSPAAAGSGPSPDTPAKVENFTLADVNGAKHSLTDYRGSKAIVLMFIATQCPVSNAYNERMQALYTEYSGKGVTFLGINANSTEPVEEVRSHAQEHGFGFTVLKDAGGKIAERLQASVTPEIYLLDPQLDLLYHGRIDDDRRGSNITSQDLRKALDEVLAGKPVSVPRTKAFGCSIKRGGA